jgi:hypothetical protein
MIGSPQKIIWRLRWHKKLQSQSKKNPNVKTSGDIPDYEL